MPTHCGRWLKPNTVVAHLHDQSLVFDAKLGLNSGTIRMADYVVNALFEDEKHLAPDIRSDREVVLASRSAKLKTDVACRKYIRGKLAHSLLQITKLFLGWV